MSRRLAATDSSVRGRPAEPPILHFFVSRLCSSMYFNVSFKLTPFSFLTLATNVFHSVGFVSFPKPNSKGAAWAAILAPDEITSPAARAISPRSPALIF